MYAHKCDHSDCGEREESSERIVRPAHPEPRVGDKEHYAPDYNARKDRLSDHPPSELALDIAETVVVRVGPLGQHAVSLHRSDGTVNPSLMWGPGTGPWRQGRDRRRALTRRNEHGPGLLPRRRRRPLAAMPCRQTGCDFFARVSPVKRLAVGGLAASPVSEFPNLVF